jgi:phospholipid transport system substrate-binding protein
MFFDFSRKNAENRKPLKSPRKILRVIGTAVLIAISFTLVAGHYSAGVASLDDGAMAMTQGLVRRSLQILRNTNAPVTQRRRDLRAVLEGHFDFAEMSRSALGYHWRTLTPEQRNEFTNLFKAFIEDAYLSKIQDYKGQDVQFLRERPLGAGYVEIDSKIVQAGKDPIPVNYLLEQKDGGWMIYDVTVDAISIIANYRNQFNRVINDQGYPKLVSDLRAKQQQLASLLGGL